jgi:hypothetical protein
MNSVDSVIDLACIGTDVSDFVLYVMIRIMKRNFHTIKKRALFKLAP